MMLNQRPFGKIQQGIKTLELRLYDEKRQAIKLGDLLEFKLRDSPDGSVLTRVVGLMIYPKFENIIDQIPTALMGYDETQRDYLRTSMYEYYSREDEALYGVLGIRFERVN